jgi:hypothetical protein
MRTLTTFGRNTGAARASRLVATILSVGLLAALALASPAAARSANARAADANSVTKSYVETFYPRWFTYYQGLIAPHNRLAGPTRVSPIYQIVVAINNDTLYASTFVDVTTQPVILTVPSATDVGYSVLNLDLFGNSFDSGVPSHAAGSTLPTTVYALVGPGYTGAIPAGSTRIQMPYNVSTLIFRADRAAPNGDDNTQAAEQFRAALQIQTLADYNLNPAAGATSIFPEIYFAAPFKTAADTLARWAPIRFLTQMQVAVHSSATPPLTAQEQAASNAFDSLFGTGGSNVTKPATRVALARGTRAAHKAIIDNYLDNRGRYNWIHFTNMAAWGDNVLDRASITEFIQYGNGIKTAAYYHTFRDRVGAALTGSGRREYVLTFPKGGQPPAGRFWSLTAYTPNSIELIPNAAKKYLVASYTPGLHTNSDGSVSIYISRVRPRGVPKANWLPVSSRPFNVMLRVYGVESGSSVANNTYVPPPVVRRVVARRGR